MLMAVYLSIREDEEEKDFDIKSNKWLEIYQT